MLLLLALKCEIIKVGMSPSETGSEVIGCGEGDIWTCWLKPILPHKIGNEAQSCISMASLHWDYCT